MDSIKFNRALNEMKEAHPDDIALIEGIQQLFNRDVEVISDRSRKALRQFPMQFTQRISRGGGEWTTQLHMWADCQVEDLLKIDPLYLTARNSDDETVLMSLLLAAMGKYTQQVNYDLIQKILDKNMNYVALTRPGDESSKTEGSAWNEKDLEGRSALDYLADFATGTGMFEGSGPDDQVREMLEKFAEEPQEAPETDQVIDETFDEGKAQAEIQHSEQEIDRTTETNPEEIPVPGTETEEKQVEIVQKTPDSEESGAEVKKIDKKQLIDALLTLGSDLP